MREYLTESVTGLPNRRAFTYRFNTDLEKETEGVAVKIALVIPPGLAKYDTLGEEMCYKLLAETIKKVDERYPTKLYDVFYIREWILLYIETPDNNPGKFNILREHLDSFEQEYSISLLTSDIRTVDELSALLIR